MSRIMGFTGTREGMTPKQERAFKFFMSGFGPEWFHHGDCIGADATAHDLVLLEGASIAIHPPTDTRLRAFCKGAKKVYDPRPYLVRDRDIVMCSDLLVAAPKQMHEVLRSGTWTTLRYAKSKKTPWLIVYPNGALDSSFGPVPQFGGCLMTSSVIGSIGKPRHPSQDERKTRPIMSEPTEPTEAERLCDRVMVRGTGLLYALEGKIGVTEGLEHARALADIASRAEMILIQRQQQQTREAAKAT